MSLSKVAGALHRRYPRGITVNYNPFSIEKAVFFLSSGRILCQYLLFKFNIENQELPERRSRMLFILDSG